MMRVTTSCHVGVVLLNNRIRPVPRVHNPYPLQMISPYLFVRETYWPEKLKKQASQHQVSFRSIQFVSKPMRIIVLVKEQQHLHGEEGLAGHKWDCQCCRSHWRKLSCILIVDRQIVKMRVVHNTKEDVLNENGADRWYFEKMQW